MTCKVYYDLHIHSVLSPCSSDDMTPNNIVNMSQLKQLDMIAVTDHNSCENLEAIETLCKQKDIVLIPGIEVESIEGVHLLCYFKSVPRACEYSQFIATRLGGIKNQEHIFGHQWVMNEFDEIVRSKKTLLIQSTTLTIDEIVKSVHEFEGLVFAAHINKPSYSIVSQLGFIPKHLKLAGVELNRDLLAGQMESFKTLPYRILVNSDAHDLMTLSEREYCLCLEKKSIDSFFAYFMEA